MSLLTQNSKMRKSTNNNSVVYNFTLPAFQSNTGFKTCPMAGTCAAGCYARSGTYRFSNVAKKHEANLEASRSIEFVNMMIAEINQLLTKHKNKALYIRIHDAGDFYSKHYLIKWNMIIGVFLNNPKVQFYAYTKSISLVQSVIIHKNLKFIFSLGGKEDFKINQETMPHSKVFETIEELEAAGYVDASNNDLIAADPINLRIGLVYHGVKKYENTLWSNIKNKGA